MKATELMVGDLVCLKDDTKYELPLKVDGVLTDDISLEGEGFLGGAEALIRPIPLTPQILEKNGFHTNYDHTLLGSCIYRRMCGKYDEYEVVVRMLNGWVKIKSYDDRVTDILTIDIQPRFVHKLQHALRICGLNELADNFKV